MFGVLGRSSLGRALPDDRRPVRRSLTSLGLIVDARSFPSGLAWTIVQVPRVWSGRSLTSRGLSVDARSFPSGLAWTLVQVPRVWSGRSCGSLGFGLIALSLLVGERCGLRVRRWWLGLGFGGGCVGGWLCDGLHGKLLVGFWGGCGVLWGCFPCVCGGFGWCWGGFGVGVGRV